MKKNSIKKEAIWYILATLVPMIFNFLRTPILTRYFTTDQMGTITIINTTFSYISMICFAWITTSIWRYYYKYKAIDIDILKSNINFLLIISIVISCAIAIFWAILENNNYLRLIIGLGLMNNTLMQSFNIYLVFSRLEGKAKTFSLVNIIISSGSFFILLFFTFGLKMGIETFFISSIIVEIIVLIVYSIFNRHLFKINLSQVNLQIIKEIFKYGTFSSLIALNLLILTSSDRYIIQFFDGIEAVGIYNQVYVISEYSIMAFSIIFFNLYNPTLLKSYEINDNNSTKIQWNLMNIYIIILFPLAILFSIFSKQIADLLLGNEFKIGYKMMPFIMLTAFIYGVSQFYSSKFKYIGKMKVVLIGMALSSIINIVGNIILVPLFDYKIASMTTLFSYTILLIYFYWNDNEGYLVNKNNKNIIKGLLIITFTMVIIHFIIINIFTSLGIICSILEGSIYLFLIYYYMYKKYSYYIDINTSYKNKGKIL